MEGPMIDPAGPTPIHRQLYEILRAAIRDGLDPDAPLPSERELSETYGVARMTARKAVDQLVLEGLAYRVPAKGAFVAKRRLVMPVALRSFTDDIGSRGMVPSSRELERRVEPLDTEDAALLGLLPGAQVYVLERLRLADGEPIALECSQVPCELAAGLFEALPVGGSLYEVLKDRFGLVIEGGTQTIGAHQMSAAEAKILGAKSGSPALRFVRQALCGGRAMERVTSIYRADRYELEVSFGSGRAVG